jgi:peroxiredoxin
MFPMPLRTSAEFVLPSTVTRLATLAISVDPAANTARLIRARWRLSFWQLLLGLLPLIPGLNSQPVLGQSASPTGSEVPAYGPLGIELSLVPQTLLGLIHAPEVQQEIQLKEGKESAFLKALREIDGPWWRARNLSATERRTVIAQQEGLLMELLSKQLNPTQLNRLRQIELQAQGARMLLRPEVGDFLQLTPAQRSEAEALFSETERQLTEANLPENRDEQTKLNAAQQTKRGEAAAALKLLSPVQQQKLPDLLGPKFDTTRLSRIYPLAPELINSAAWVGDRQVKLEELRGRVVLLHFYAFQCRNCQANFKHYNRWQETLSSRGVVVVGIQTPELEDERDPAQVAAAAKEHGFQFPVLIDLENANWNVWSNTMWPTVYVIDREGYIRMWWQGELNWQGAKGDQAIEELVEKLLD